MFCVLRPDQLRRSNSLSAVRSTESRTIAVAATIQSGNLSLTLRRSAIVSSTKRLSVIPFVPNRPLVSYTVAVGIRRKYAEKIGKRPAVRIGGFFNRSLQSIFKGTVGFADCGLFCRRKGKNRLSRRYFARHVNGQPVADRYFYSLRNAHGENIA